jgi:hypothetical protein
LKNATLYQSTTTYQKAPRIKTLQGTARKLASAALFRVLR